MKILVFSDSHNRNQYMKKAIDLHRESGIDCIFHLGDGHSDLEELKLDIPIMFVDGNCDEYSYSFLEKKNVIREKSINLGGFNFLLTHGHGYNVKWSLDYAVSVAKRNNADVLLFGHTHNRYNKYLSPEDGEGKGLYVFNPGSISRPRDYSYSYGFIEIQGSNILLSHGTVL